MGRNEIKDDLPTSRETKRSIKACKKYLGKSPIKTWRMRNKMEPEPMQSMDDHDFID